MKIALILLAICLCVGCKSTFPVDPASSMEQEVSPSTSILVESDFTYALHSIEWLTDDLLLFGGLELGAKNIQNPNLTTLFLYDVAREKIDPIILSEIEGFHFIPFNGGNRSCGHDDQTLYLYGSRYQQGNKYESRFFVKIPYRDPSLYEMVRHDQNVINRISVTQGKLIIGTSDVMTNQFIIRDGFTGEETPFSDEIAYQVESASVSPDRSKLFLLDGINLRMYLPDPLLPENNSAFKPYEEKREEFWETASMVGVFNLEGELLYRFALADKSDLNAYLVYWSGNGDYLLRVDHSWIDYKLDLEVRAAEDGTLIRKQHFEDAGWHARYLSGGFFYFLSEDKTRLTIVNLSSGQEKSMEFSTAVDDIALTPNGKTAAVVRGDTIQIIDIL